MRNHLVLKHTLLASLLIILAAQMNLNLFADGFRVAMGICFLAAAAYLVSSISIPLVILFTDAGVLITRAIAGIASGSSLNEAIVNTLPELVFYLISGGLIWAAVTLPRRNYHQAIYAFLVCAIDFLSNLIELLIRLTTAGLNSRILIVLLLVAVVRATVLLIILVIATEYRLTLLQRANAEQYQNLMMLMAQLQGEISWMEKGSLDVEQIMSNAYSLYTKLDETGAPRELVHSALDISKDIHEVKKAYALIVRGIRDVIEGDAAGPGMDVRHLLMLVADVNMTGAKGPRPKPEILVDCPEGLSTDTPYVILSVFNNLITNALEAFEDAPERLKDVRPRIRITCAHSGDEYTFHVSDNGPGIDESIAAHLFEPGYSTKINYDTGVVGRGLGLAIVQDMVTTVLGGKIRFETGSDGTTFTLTVPKTTFREI